ncbi:TetR/AcrR family transcriptional regulator [Streptomyces sp. CA-250714]
MSKRTVYDHFGDKRTLFQSVLVRVNDALAVTVRTALDESSQKEAICATR